MRVYMVAGLLGQFAGRRLGGRLRRLEGARGELPETHLDRHADVAHHHQPIAGQLGYDQERPGMTHDVAADRPPGFVAPPEHLDVEERSAVSCLPLDRLRHCFIIFLPT